MDLALGMKTIEIIKKRKLLSKNERMGHYILNKLRSIDGMLNQRGLGLMLAFEVKNPKMRDNLIAECARRGLLVLGCGQKGIRLVPPYVIEEEEADIALGILERSLKSVSSQGFTHHGAICEFVHCGKHHS